jgi:hypothetical protein
MSTTAEMEAKAKEAIRGHVWQGRRWKDVLPARYAGEEDAGFERQYVRMIVAAFNLAIEKGYDEEKTKKLLAKNLDAVFQKRYEKTMEMKAEANAKKAEKERAKSVPRSKTPRATGAELVEKKQSALQKAQAKLEELQSKAAVESRKNEVAAAIAGKNLGSLTPAQVSHFRGRATSVLKHNKGVALSNVLARNKSLRAESRARSAAKKSAAAAAGPGNNNNAASVSTTRSTTRKRTDGMTMEELCAIASKLQASSTSPITLDDVRAYLKKKNAQKKSKTYAKLAKFNSNDDE